MEREEDSIHSHFIYFHSYCLEPVSPIKKLGAGEGQFRRLGGGLDHSATETAPIKGGITVEQGALIADDHPSRVRAGRWPLDMGPSRAVERIIRKVTEERGEQGGTMAGVLSGC